MCTYLTNKVELIGSAKGAEGWFAAKEATVYLDHPVHALYDHSLNIDFINPDLGASFRVAVELDPKSAVALAHAILETVSAFPELAGKA
ncbi:hypothetical protein SAMN02745225_01764 [Ferrithrix thermotolerans DSM 19514]|jgi:hypothetical protein|uniref:Uncharacterized protein n=1 Tax=Ferrithrix thermotolerans DSM 19514 TaxID=1121881 RepID=A0A1M4WRK8_9ACTN|nr:DUF6295 family protein [Ferrithrix thermotolerans]SHE83849.1 hypothetical protein SAMN02745225_01764 [Ferrithrix thermotolerans DSM 19514]